MISSSFFNILDIITWFCVGSSSSIRPSPILTRPHTQLGQVLPTTQTNTGFPVVPRLEPSATAINKVSFYHVLSFTVCAQIYLLVVHNM